MNYEDKFRGYSIDTLLSQLIDAKKHNFLNEYMCRTIETLVCTLIKAAPVEVLNMLLSNDQEIKYLGIQMLFKDYLNQYNELCENIKWEKIVNDVVLRMIYHGYSR